jgi:hypothetical protein
LSLNLRSTPTSTVVLDNASIGSSPKASISVWAGTHTVVFRTGDGLARKTLVTCAPGETKNVDVKLSDLPAVESAHATDPDPCPLCDRP